MPFTGQVILLVGLMEIVLPAYTIRLSEAGFLNWPARGMFTAEDATYGTIGSVEAISDSASDEAPGGRLTLLPPSITASGALYQSSAQGSPIRFWMAAADRTTGLIIGTPELRFDGFVDTMTLRAGRGKRSVEIEFMVAERLFLVREGNVLSTRFHQLAYPGELGFDHATGAQTAVAWGVPDPARGSVFFGNGGGGGGGSFFGKVSSS